MASPRVSTSRTTRAVALTPALGGVNLELPFQRRQLQEKIAMKHLMGSRLFGPAMLLTAVGLLFLGGVIQAGNGKGKGNGKDDGGDDQDGPSFRVSLSGGAEAPAILTTGEGVLNLKVD